jgi:LacI family purine nucleotide synthesis repressor
MGVRCPQDVSIVGYDNFSYSAISERMFTTYEVDTREMARKAVHNMIHKLNGEYYRKGVTIVTGRIVERDSVRDFVNSNN